MGQRINPYTSVALAKVLWLIALRWVRSCDRWRRSRVMFSSIKRFWTAQENTGRISSLKRVTADFDRAERTLSYETTCVS